MATRVKPDADAVRELVLKDLVFFARHYSKEAARVSRHGSRELAMINRASARSLIFIAKHLKTGIAQLLHHQRIDRKHAKQDRAWRKWKKEHQFAA